jgi:hypothetical protein
LPCRLIVAVLVTVRRCDHKNTSCSCAGGGWRRRGAVGEAGQEPLGRPVSGLAVLAPVVDGLDPCGEQLVELRQIRGDTPVAELDEELLAEGAEEPFDLDAAGGLPGLGVRQRDAQAGQRPQQLGADEGAAVST